MMTTIDTKTLNEKWGLIAQVHHSPRFLFLILLLSLFSGTIMRGQTPTLPSVATSCDYATAPANMVLSVGSEPVGYNKKYILVDMATGRIAQVNATAPSFTAVPQGNYYATAAYYHGTLVNAVADSLISKVYTDSLGQSACLIYAPSVALRVCSSSCDFNGTSVTINFTATASPTSGVTTTYVLINEMTNRVLQTSTTASFTAVPEGSYAVAAVYYSGSFAIAVGDTLYKKTTNDTLCVGVSNTIHYNVCACQAGTTAPIITQTMASNTCPTATVDLSTMTNTGTKPTGTTLIWSTHNTPSVSGDTLTNLAVSTAGKYYAFYYDKVNNCYSPADSVIVIINIAPSAPTTTVTQPTCNVATGTITVTAPTSDVSYSFDNGGTYQASAISSALAAGTYQVMVKDSTSGCVSTAASTVINAQPATPTITNVSKTDPSVSSCPAANDGTITVTATGSNLQYSKDNGATWQASNTFSGLVAGSYTIKVRDSISTCEIANASNPVVLAAPACPTCTTPSVGGTTATTATLPLCSTANSGTITLSGHTGSVVKWQTSTNGGTSWTDIASTSTTYSFTNAANNQQYRAVVNSGGICVDATSSATTITTSVGACSVSCDVPKPNIISH